MSGGHARVLHIGQRKTGTTWLQTAAKRAAEAGLLAAEHANLLHWSRSVTAKSATDEDYEVMAALLPDAPDRPALASCETLVVHDPVRMAAAVARRWPEAHVLVTTRAPQDYLMSSFRNDTTTGHESAADFTARFSRGHMRRSHDLDRIAAAYGEAFGKDRVHFLPYELLRDNSEEYVRRLESLLGVAIGQFLVATKVNASPPAAFLVIARRVNALVHAEAPDILETKDWLNFMRLAMLAAGAAQGLDDHYAEFLRESPKVSDALPRLDQATEASLAERMSILAELPDFKPYLRRYGVRQDRQA